MSAHGFSGFLSPIEAASGSFPSWPHDPLSCEGCYWSDPYYQALPSEYSFAAHHDMRTLIALSGGDDAFVARLDKHFSPGADPAGDPRFGKTIFNPGNEPSFVTAPVQLRPRKPMAHSAARPPACSRPLPRGEGLPARQLGRGRHAELATVGADRPLPGHRHHHLPRLIGRMRV